jgi:hypothetical protein
MKGCLETLINYNIIPELKVMAASSSRKVSAEFLE